MSDTEHLHNLRHTLAHLLATATKEWDPAVKLGIGPVTEDGFYYDFKFSEGRIPSPEDLTKLETSMRALIGKKLAMSGREIDKTEGEKLFADQPFKTELLTEYAGEGKTLTAYTVGEFTDLCKGGHLDNTSAIDPEGFSLTKIAGAYWRGDEKNPMLTRIYGVAFTTKVERDTYITQLEEAKKRDHRKLGKELGLFVFSDLVGAGLPLWTPKGTILREVLNDYVWQLRKKRGYQKVTIPHITKKGLYETSGHWSKYADDLFKVSTREGHEYAMKPMNCPHHAQIFAAFPHSYRDMPQRFAETTMVYRDEQSGELSGLSRVLAITQDDAHVFCREVQIEEEVFAIWDIIDNFYSTFGFNELRVRFSRHDPDNFDKYLGTPETWKKSEDAILSLMKKRGIIDYIDGKGEAAIYGPKIDFIAKDSIGRTQQIATIQLDFNQPKNFGLVCTNEKGEKEMIVMIHCAIMGSIERFLSVLIEHLGGNFPLWLAPTQVALLPISDDQMPFTNEIAAKLREADIRVDVYGESESLGKKIRATREERIPYRIVVGKNEVAEGKVSLESREGEKSGPYSPDELLRKLIEEVNIKK
jgi:threonyl-tRNA synthetase